MKRKYPGWCVYWNDRWSSTPIGHLESSFGRCSTMWVGMGNALGNLVIDRHCNSRQQRPQNWYSHLKSFDTAGIQVAKIENYVLHWYLSYPGSHPCATSALVYWGLFWQESIKHEQHTNKTETRISSSGCKNQTHDVGLPEIVSSEATLKRCVEAVGLLNLY